MDRKTRLNAAREKIPSTAKRTGGRAVCVVCFNGYDLTEKFDRKDAMRRLQDEFPACSHRVQVFGDGPMAEERVKRQQETVEASEPT